MNKQQQPVIAFLLVLACTGFLLPRVELGGTRVALTDMVSLLIIVLVACGPTVYARFQLGLRKFELAYAAVLLVLGLGYFVVFSDTASLAISARLLVFCAAGLCASGLTKTQLEKSLLAATAILVAWYAPATLHALLSLVTGEVSLFEFMWNYDAGRLTAPYEQNGTSSVPLGYLFSFVFLFSLYRVDTRRSAGAVLFALVALALCFLTASRASLLGAALGLLVFLVTWARRWGVLGGIAIVLTCLPVIAAVGMVVLEKTLLNDSLDGSGSQRLDYYNTAITNLLSNPVPLLFGYGVSDLLLLNRTGVAFYESLFFNSLAQGGLVLLIPTIGVISHPLFKALSPGRSAKPVARNMLAIGLVVFIGNAIGGANFFSIYAYAYYSLLFHLLIRQE